MDYSPLGSSVHGILQVKTLEWIAILFSRGSSWPRNQAQVSCIASRRFTIWATREARTNSNAYRCGEGNVWGRQAICEQPCRQNEHCWKSKGGRAPAQHFLVDVHARRCQLVCFCKRSHNFWSVSLKDVLPHPHLGLHGSVACFLGAGYEDLCGSLLSFRKDLPRSNKEL